MIRKYASILAVLAAAASTLTLAAAGPASAAVGCSAAEGSSCVEVDYQTDSVKSIRVNDRCLTGGTGRHPDVIVGKRTTPNVLTYGGAACEGGTHNSARVNWTDDNRDGYRIVWIKASGGGCGLSVAEARPAC